MTLTKAKSAPTVRVLKKAGTNGHAMLATGTIKGGIAEKKIPGWMKAVAASKAKRAALREIKEAREKFIEAAKKKQHNLHAAPETVDDSVGLRSERGQGSTDKPWTEITPAQQVERMRGIVKFMENKIEAMRQRMEMLEQHQHGPMGQLFVPYNRYEIEDRMRGHFAETKKREEMFF